MGRLQTKVAKCEYRECDRLLAWQIIGGLNDDNVTDDILREVTVLENTEEAISKCMLI